MRISKQALIDAADTAIKADATAEAEHPAKVAAAKVDARAKCDADTVSPRDLQEFGIDRDTVRAVFAAVAQ